MECEFKFVPNGFCHKMMMSRLLMGSRAMLRSCLLVPEPVLLFHSFLSSALISHKGLSQIQHLSFYFQGAGMVWDI